jgi:hypothetical protein
LWGDYVGSRMFEDVQLACQGRDAAVCLLNVKIKFGRSAVISRLEASKNLIIRPWRHTVHGE